MFTASGRAAGSSSIHRCLEAGVMQTFWQSAIFLGSGREIGPLGSAHPLTAPYQAFATQDGWITIGGSNQANFERLASGARGAGASPRRAISRQRIAHGASGRSAGLIGGYLRRKPSSAWLAALTAAGVPAGPVLTVAEMLSHPQVLARDMVVETDASQGGQGQRDRLSDQALGDADRGLAHRAVFRSAHA